MHQPPELRYNNSRVVEVAGRRSRSTPSLETPQTLPKKKDRDVPTQPYRSSKVRRDCRVLRRYRHGPFRSDMVPPCPRPTTV